MESWAFLTDVVVLLALALAVGLVFERLRLGAMLGYLVAGMFAGPFIAGDSIALASEIGVALLLFTIGLETSWGRVRAMGAMAAGGGTVQVLATTGVVLGTCLLVGVDWRTALVLGFIVSMSSTATVLRALQERGEQDSLHGKAALGVLLLQDGAVVPTVLITTLLGAGGTAAQLAEGLSMAAIRAVLLTFGLILIGGRLLPKLLGSEVLSRNRELPILLVVCACLGSTIAAHFAGLSPALGAFVAGMILADSPLVAQMRSDIGPLRAVLVTLFFVSVGMQADLPWLVEPFNFGRVLGLVGFIVVGKALIVMLVLRLFGAARSTAVAAALCLAQIGEFAFVLAGVARKNLLFSEDLFLVVAMTALFTLLLTPWLVAAARRAGKAVGRGEPGPGGAAAPHEPHVLLVGYGPAGLEVVQQLQEAEIQITVISVNPHGAQQAAAAGLRAYVGDASSAEVLHHAGIDSAIAAVITIPDHVAAAEIMAELRAIRPGMPVIARARYHRHAERMRISEEETIVDEEEAVGRLLGFEAYLATQRVVERVRAAEQSATPPEDANETAENSDASVAVVAPAPGEVGEGGVRA